MKKQLLLRNSLFFLTLYFLLGSCKSNTSISHQDSLKIQAWDRLFGKTTDTALFVKAMDKIVNAHEANECVELYKSLHPGNAPLATWAVGFDNDALIKWLLANKNNPNTHIDSIRVCFGAYTQKFLNHNPPDSNDPRPSSHKKDRLTVFLWPYWKGKPAVYTTKAAQDSVEAFNLGSLYP